MLTDWLEEMRRQWDKEKHRVEISTLTLGMCGGRKTQVTFAPNGDSSLGGRATPFRMTTSQVRLQDLQMPGRKKGRPRQETEGRRGNMR